MCSPPDRPNVQPTGLSCCAACRPALLCSSPARENFMLFIWQHGPPTRPAPGPPFSVILIPFPQVRRGKTKVVPAREWNRTATNRRIETHTAWELSRRNSVLQTGSTWKTVGRPFPAHEWRPSATACRFTPLSLLSAIIQVRHFLLRGCPLNPSNYAAPCSADLWSQSAVYPLAKQIFGSWISANRSEARVPRSLFEFGATCCGDVGCYCRYLTLWVKSKNVLVCVAPNKMLLLLSGNVKT